MPVVLDVPADLLIPKIAEQLRNISQVSPPSWSPFVKTGAHTQRTPQIRDWWFVRCSSILRKIYLTGPVGLKELASEYGGRRKTSYYGPYHRDAGRSIIRKALQQLEAADLVVKQGIKGRVITPKGMSLLDKTRTHIAKDIEKGNPDLARYF